MSKPLLLYPTSFSVAHCFAFISQELSQVTGTKWQIYLCQVCHLLTRDISFFFHAGVYFCFSYKGLNHFHDTSGYIVSFSSSAMSGIKARLYICEIPLPLRLPCLKMPLSMCLFRREPLALINLKKKNEETGEEELASRLDHCKAKATRHIFLIRHSQYNLDGRADKDRTLTPLGRYH